MGFGIERVHNKKHLRVKKERKKRRKKEMGGATQKNQLRRKLKIKGKRRRKENEKNLCNLFTPKAPKRVFVNGLIYLVLILFVLPGFQIGVANAKEMRE